MTSKTRDRLTTVMDVVMAGVLALVPVAVVGSWLVGAVVFALGVMWILRPKEPGAPPVQRETTGEEEGWEEYWEYEHYYSPSAPGNTFANSDNSER